MIIAWCKNENGRRQNPDVKDYRENRPEVSGEAEGDRQGMGYTKNKQYSLILRQESFIDLSVLRSFTFSQLAQNRPVSLINYLMKTYIDIFDINSHKYPHGQDKFFTIFPA